MKPSETNMDAGRKDLPVVFDGIVGSCAAMQAVFQRAQKVARTDSTVLITGETGTGKGMIAKAIHELSTRCDKPFITVNCGAIPENLLESELFGHLRGAFTGATTNRSGKFDQADGGTLFLDEIGDMSPNLQVKILRALEEKRFEPVGGGRTISVDVRIVAATHRDLEAAVGDGRFREDLFYRLFVIPIQMPPLSARAEDIPHLIEHYLNHFSRHHDTSIEGIHPTALNMLIHYKWPGNVRELRNLIERLVVLSDHGQIMPADLPHTISDSLDERFIPQVDLADDGICLSAAVSEFEKALIMQSLEKTNWVKNQAAKLLQLNRTTLVEKIKRHQLQSDALSAKK